jgi:sensor c-di-GMP phosphodiesterase-like protein
MRPKATLVLIAVGAAIALAFPPWFALNQARRQAFEIESSMASNHARDILHRGDTMAAQALAGIARLRASGAPPCSGPALALAREIALESSYIQAIGRLDGASMTCSSLGDPLCRWGHRHSRPRTASPCTAGCRCPTPIGTPCWPWPRTAT